jgi:hypothetical protein
MGAGEGVAIRKKVSRREGGVEEEEEGELTCQNRFGQTYSSIISGWVSVNMHLQTILLSSFTINGTKTMRPDSKPCATSLVSVIPIVATSV